MTQHHPPSQPPRGPYQPQGGDSPPQPPGSVPDRSSHEEPRRGRLGSALSNPFTAQIVAAVIGAIATVAAAWLAIVLAPPSITGRAPQPETTTPLPAPSQPPASITAPVDPNQAAGDVAPVEKQQPAPIDPPESSMPDVTGDRLRDAQRRLEQEGITNLTEEPTLVIDQNQDGRVMHQSPSAGSRVTPGQRAVLVIGEFSADQGDSK
jgi:PASTA domain